MGGCKVEKYFVTRSVILEDSWCIRSGRVSTSWGPVLRPPPSTRKEATTSHAEIASEAGK